MTNDTPTEPIAEPDPSADSPAEPRTSFRSALRGLRRAASEVADASAEEARKLAEAARPEIERRAKQAKAAAEAARPQMEQKARDETDYVRDHQEEIVRASKRGAEVAASTAARAVTPRPLRPALDAMQRELRDPPTDEDASDAADHEHTATPETGEEPTTSIEDPRT